jgi:hypothetical protein
VTVVINPMKEFETVDWSAASSGTLIDPWRCLSPAATGRVGRYVPMGRGSGLALGEWPASNDLAEKLRLLNS